MKTIANRTVIIIVLLATILMPACSLQQNTAAPAAPEVNVEAITQEVLAQIDSQQAQTIPVTYSQSTTSVTTTDLQNELINLYKQANPAVVYIIVPPLGSGSGFVYSNDGYIVTNNHVVDGGSSFEIVFSDGTRAAAKLVGTDVDSDLAVLKVDQLPDGVSALPLAQNNSLQVGQFVVAIGNPFGEQGSMSLGIVSGLGRSLPSQRQIDGGSSYTLPEVIQTDAPINPGNSGGPLLNLNGEVVGINSAIATTSGTSSGVGFSIPVAAVHQVVPSLIENGSYEYSYMGAGFDSEVSLDEESVYGLSQTQGAYVLNVTPNSPADEAGLIAANANTGRGGDLIVTIDGQSIQDFADLNAYLVFNTTAGQTIDLTVLRNGKEVSVPLVLGERP
ncbi:MAG: trypsin-like peptidase domain-containing protein [Ardenticatenaceae bacterium]|nr:trypsin-like peptidase domain-containing protein [Ardenticatenaceae bacterium]